MCEHHEQGSGEWPRSPEPADTRSPTQIHEDYMRDCESYRLRRSLEALEDQELWSPRQDILSWDDYFLGLACMTAAKSKDPSTRVGAFIATSSREPVSQGFNGLPRGSIDDADCLKDRDWKYPRIIHAEVNAILFANRDKLRGAHMYVWPMPPCAQCAPIIAQSGIARVYAPRPQERWRERCEMGRKLLEESGVECVWIEP